MTDTLSTLGVVLGSLAFTEVEVHHLPVQVHAVSGSSESDGYGMLAVEARRLVVTLATISHVPVILSVATPTIERNGVACLSL